MRISDWSSDVCSSDLQARPLIGHPLAEQLAQRIAEGALTVRQVEKLVAVGREVGGLGDAARAKGGRPASAPSAKPAGDAPVKKDADTLAFERGQIGRAHV